MGTRGFWGVRDNSRTRLTYNHFDSYPTGLGVDLAEFIAGADLTTLGDRVFDLTLVNEEDNPSEDQMLALVASGTWEQVSTGADWYSALRGTQGHPKELIESGFWMDLGYDPLVETDTWLEWGYVIDLDAGELVVYDLGYGVPPKTAARIPFADLANTNAADLMATIENQD